MFRIIVMNACEGFRWVGRLVREIVAVAFSCVLVLHCGEQEF